MTRRFASTDLPGRRPALLHSTGRRLTALVLLGSMAMASVSHSEDRLGIGYDRIADGAFSVVAEVRAKPGKEADLRAVTLPLVKLVRSDPKSLAYFLQEDRESSGHFIFYEIFANKADFEAHNAQPYVQAWFALLPELAHGGVKVMRMEILNGPGG
jgi:quinol monooxygenase YgiN